MKGKGKGGEDEIKDTDSGVFFGRNQASHSLGWNQKGEDEEHADNIGGRVCD